MAAGQLRQRAAGMVAICALIAVVVVSYKPGSFGAQAFMSATVSALFIGAGLAVSATGLVVTYTTSGIFNFSHGAIGMLGAFSYWQLRFGWGLPAPLAFVLVVFVIAPLFGAGLEIVLMRRLTSAPLVAQLVVTVSLLFVMVAIAKQFWEFPNGEPQVPAFFGSSPGFKFFGVNVSWHYAITIVVAALLAVGLRLLLFKTRTGITMRAVVDNRSLAALTGARPQRSGMLAWALSCSLAALAGILLLPDTTLNKAILTLFVIKAFAAAILGRLRSLPLTFVGAILLGMAQSYSGTFLDLSGRWTNLHGALPSLFLLVMLLFLPQDRLETQQFAPSRRLFRIPTLREATIGMIAIAFFMLAMSYLLSDIAGLNKLTGVMTVAILAISLVPLTGWAGQVSLGQAFFVGVGCWAFTTGFARGGNLVGLIPAAIGAAIAGALVALPALRLRGLYLALATLAIASAATQIFYPQHGVMEASLSFNRPVIFGIDLANQRSFLMFCCFVFAIIGLALVALRRSRFGRRLVAMKNSPAACATLGVNLTVTKLIVFMISAAIAGVAGVMVALDHNGVQQSSEILNPINGLSTVLFAVIGGVGLIGGAFAGGFFSGMLDFIKLHLTVSPFAGLFKTLDTAGPGLAALNIIANPDGIAGAFSDGFGAKLPWRRHESKALDPQDIPSVSGAGHVRGFTAADLAAMDTFLGVPVPARLDLDEIEDRSALNATLSSGA